MAILVAFDVDVVDVAFGCVFYCGCFVIRFGTRCGGISFWGYIPYTLPLRISCIRHGRRHFN